MTTSSDPTRRDAPPGFDAAGELPPLPSVDMLASGEMRAWIARLDQENRQIGSRNRYLLVALGVGTVLLVVILGYVYQATIGSYAVLDEVSVRQHPASQGRLEISFRVVSPGRVQYRRTSGAAETDLVDQFAAAGEVRRAWAWGYEPGRPIEAALWYRKGWFRTTERAEFPTAASADLVVLIDTTGSMDPSIAALKEKCITFSERLSSQALKHRLALVGFGDRREEAWLDRSPFTADVREFQAAVGAVKRFDGGDLSESALDAIETALELPFHEGSLRRMFLVTDAPYHEPSRSGATAEKLAARLAEERVVLDVFSRPQFEEPYRKLQGDMGRFQEIENFGRLLSEGRVLED